MTRTVSNMPFRIIFAAFVMAVFASTAFSSESESSEVRELLKKMVAAVHTLNYEGTFVLLHGNQLESMQVIHTMHNGSERERLISLNGAAREVVRDNVSITCITPDSKSVSIGNRIVGRGFRAVFSIDQDKLSSYYTFFLLGEERVANRDTTVVGIIPKDDYRYGYRIYLDQEYALPLKTDMLNASGNAVSQIMFTHLNVGDSVKDLAEASIAGKEDYSWVQQKPVTWMQNVKENRWDFNNLPKGFSVTLHTRKSIELGGPEIDHFVISDGLASLSLYAEKSIKVSGLRGNSVIGAVNAYGTEYNGYQITVVGEVPALTVEQVAQSIQRQNQ